MPLQKSVTSGANIEAGLTSRYTGDRVPDAWYEVDLAVTRNEPFMLQALETYNGDPQRLNIRDIRQEGTVAYRRPWSIRHYETAAPGGGNPGSKTGAVGRRGTDWSGSGLSALCGGSYHQFRWKHHLLGFKTGLGARLPD